MGSWLDKNGEGVVGGLAVDLVLPAVVVVVADVTAEDLPISLFIAVRAGWDDDAVLFVVVVAVVVVAVEVEITSARAFATWASTSQVGSLIITDEVGGSMGELGVKVGTVDRAGVVVMTKVKISRFHF